MSDPSITYIDSNATPIADLKDDNATQSAWVLNLPAEIRRMILIAAFGDLTLHIQFDIYHVAKRPQGVVPQNHAGLPVPKSDQWRDPSKAPEYQWFSCVCHRMGPEADNNSVPLWKDLCFSGEAEACELWPGETPHKCKVGALGWLRSCRQAYFEGIRVLYSNNTFSLTSGKLLDVLLSQPILPSDSLIRQSHLHMITSLEFNYLSNYFYRNQSIERIHRRLFEFKVKKILEAFPSLQTLYISFDDGFYLRDDPVDLKELDETFLNPVAKWLISPAHPIELTLALPTIVFHDVRERAQEQGNDILTSEPEFDRKIWHPVAGLGGEDKGKKGRPLAGCWIAPGARSYAQFDYFGAPIHFGPNR